MSPDDYSDAPRVAIESPFADPTPEGLAAKAAYLRRCLADAFRRGEAPFASHGLYTLPSVLDDTIPEERKRGITAGYAWAKTADRWVFYTDLGWSSGMRSALDVAAKLGARIEVRTFHRSPNLRHRVGGLGADRRDDLGGGDAARALAATLRR